MVTAWRFTEDDTIAGQITEVPRTVIRLRSPYSPYGYVNLLDALQTYRISTKLCLVSLSGEMGTSNGKVIASKQTVLVMVDIEPVLHWFALRCAEQALKLIPNPDPRSLTALQTKCRWLEGKTSDWELVTASRAARDAAWAAAESAWSAREAVVYAAEARVEGGAPAYAAALRVAAERGAAHAASLAAREAAEDIPQPHEAAADLTAVHTAAWAAREAAAREAAARETEEGTYTTGWDTVMATVNTDEVAATAALAEVEQSIMLSNMVMELPEFEPFKGVV